MFHSQKRENATIFKTPGTETTSAASIISTSQGKAKQATIKIMKCCTA
jgi:hypothetical protein